ncbi:hypothetical protein WCLP8_2590005 [uncultured Gammaproteobacteria bacterium]
MVRPETPIIQALATLNEAHQQVVLVGDRDRHLLGVVTDSDIRRAMLNRVDFARPVAEIMKPDPLTVGPEPSERDVGLCG